MLRVERPFAGAAAGPCVYSHDREDQVTEALRHGMRTIEKVLGMYGLPWLAEVALKALRDHHQSVLDALDAEAGLPTE
jgi:hypothetical protein